MSKMTDEQIREKILKLTNKKFINMTTTTYLLNAFSIQMLPGNATVDFQQVDELPNNLTSAVGHADTAAVLGVKQNRINVKLNIGDVAYVAQLMGGRLPEGSTTLPDGFSFKFYKITVRALQA